MKQCPRCGHWHHGHDSLTCDPCWVELGQLALFPSDEDDEYLPPIDTFFDREEEARGWQ